MKDLVGRILIMFSIVFWKKFKRGASFSGSFLAVLLISCYRAFLSGTLASGGACRFYPSCSEYALLVYKKHPFLKASLFVLRRLLDCRPFGPKLRFEPELAKPDTLKKREICKTIEKVS